MCIEPLPIEEITKELIQFIGRKLTAYIGAARDVRTVDRWIEGKDVNDEIAQRLRFAFRVVHLLAEEESPKMIQAWLIGLNPELGDRVPLRLIRESDLEQVGPEILGTARAFLVGG